MVTMAVMFALTSLLALAITPLFVSEGMQAFEDEGSVYNPIIYIGVILVFTLVLLIIIKRGFKRLINVIIMVAVFMTIAYVANPLVSALFPAPEERWTPVRGIDGGVVGVELFDHDRDGRDLMGVLYTNGTLTIRSRSTNLAWLRNCSDIATLRLGNGDRLAVVQDGRLLLLSGPRDRETTDIRPRAIDTGPITTPFDELLVVNDTGAFTRWYYFEMIIDPEDPVLRMPPTLKVSGNFTGGVVLRDTVLLVGDVISTWDVRDNTMLAAVDLGGVTPYGGGDRVILVNGSRVRVLSRELDLERTWDYAENVTDVLAVDILGDSDPELVVLEGDRVHIRYGRGWRGDWEITSIVSGVEGVDAATGEWDGDRDTLELFVITADGRVVWVSIFTGERDFLEQLAALLTPVTIISLTLAAVLTGLLAAYPEWYVLDIVGVLVSAGVASLFGISFAILPAVVLLSGLMLYDAFAVYQSKHMIDLADEAVSQHLPLLLVIPKEEGYSYLEQGSIREKIDRGEEREAMFLGMGDLIIPTVLVVSAYRWLDPGVTVGSIGGNLVVALATMFGILAGFAVLSIQVAKGRPHAGLPFLNSGALTGYFASVLAIYGTLGF